VVATTKPRPDDVDSAGAARETPFERIFILGLTLAASGAALQALSHLVNVFIFDGESWNLDAEADNNAWTWASSVATFTCAFVVVLLATFTPQRARRLWFVGLVLAFLSLDDLIKVHEQLGTAVRERLFDLPTGWGRIAWPAIFFPLLASVFLLLWQLGGDGPARARRWVRGGLALLAVAVALEIASAPWYISGRSAHSVPGALEVAVEEALELAGWIVIATALTVIMLLRARTAR